MKTSDIITTIRNQYLFDTALPHLWDDLYLVQCLMEADKEAAQRAFLITDTTNATSKDVAVGSATSTVMTGLIDSAATFTAAMVRSTVYNVSKNTWTTIDSYTDPNTLVLAADIMVSGDRYIIGSPAHALTRICVQSGIGTYSASHKIIKVKSCRLASATSGLIKKTESWLDNHYFNWRNATGTPKFFVEGSGTITVVPTPDGTLNSGTGKDTLILEVFRTPIVKLSMTGTNEPETPDQFHVSLIHWVCRLAYLKPDSESYNEGKAKYHEAAFESKFGRPISALEQENIRTIGGIMKLERPRWSRR